MFNFFKKIMLGKKKTIKVKTNNINHKNRDLGVFIRDYRSINFGLIKVHGKVALVGNDIVLSYQGQNIFKKNTMILYYQGLSATLVNDNIKEKLEPCDKRSSLEINQENKDRDILLNRKLENEKLVKEKEEKLMRIKNSHVHKSYPGL